MANYQNDIWPEFFWPDLPESRRVIFPKGSISRNVISMNDTSGLWQVGSIKFGPNVLLIISHSQNCQFGGMAFRILCMSDISISGFHYFEVLTFGWIDVKPKRPYHEFQTLRILTISMFKHVQTRTQLLITHIFNACRKTPMPIHSRSSVSTLNKSIRGRYIYCSAKWRSGKWCFGKTTFDWTTIRKNDVRLNNDSEKFRSALWSFANSTIRPCDDSVKWHLEIFCLGKIGFRQNDDSMKWHFGKMMWPQISLQALIEIYLNCFKLPDQKQRELENSSKRNAI